MTDTIICPTITAFNTHDYRAQIERVQGFAKRLHIDMMDGQLAPSVSPPLSQIWWPDHQMADIHLMYKYPEHQLDGLIKLKPSLVIIHYEAEVDYAHFAEALRAVKIKAGLALLPSTPAEAVITTLADYDHVLIFSGQLGYHGGQADLNQLSKVEKIKRSYPDIEIAWDGGINDQNALAIAESGVKVLNVGSFIHSSAHPDQAYAKIREVTNKNT
jgi:ribulose-phosphate 3-epimerase